MYSVFIETTTHIYMITSNDVTDMLDKITADIEPSDSLEVLQLYATNNNVFDEPLEGKLKTFMSSLKSEKESKCNQ